MFGQQLLMSDFFVSSVFTEIKSILKERSLDNL